MSSPVAMPRFITQRHGWLWCACAAVLFGAATPATKLIVDDLDPVSLAGLLYVGAAVAVAPLAVRDPRPVPARRQRSRLLLAIGLGGGLAPVLLVLALDRTPAATVSLFLNLELAATALAARVFLGEHIGRRAGLGITIVVLGGVVLAGASRGGVAVGALLVAATCACWGIDNAVTASLDSFTPTQITLAKGLVAGTVNLVLGVVLYGAPVISHALVAASIGALGYGVSITMWITGARLVGAARGQAVFALAPFVGAILAWPLNGDRPSAVTAFAFVVSLAGVLVATTSRHHHRHVHDLAEHMHPFDVDDPHHRADAIDVIAGSRHRHLAIVHEHEHYPDIHHRHRH